MITSTIGDSVVSVTLKQLSMDSKQALKNMKIDGERLCPISCRRSQSPSWAPDPYPGTVLQHSF